MNPVVRRVLIGGVFLIGLGVLIWPKLQPKEDLSLSFGATAGDARPAVNAVVVSPRLVLDRIFTTGVILPNEVVELSMESAGKVTGLFFDEGRVVEAGELLLKINDSELQAQFKTAELRIKQAREIEVRQRTLLEREGLSQAEYDLASNELSVQEAQLDLIRAQIDKTELRAPFGGVIGLRYVSEGSYVTSASKIATLQDIDPIKVEFSIPEKYASRVAVGDVIRYSVEGYSGTFDGQIYAFEPSIQQDTRSLRLRARSANMGTKLLPGSFVNIELVFNEIEGALTVPSVAIIPELGGAKVFLYSSGIVVPRVIETGIRMSGNVQVTSGLAPGDTVITSGLQTVFPGMPIRLATGSPSVVAEGSR